MRFFLIRVAFLLPHIYPFSKKELLKENTLQLSVAPWLPTVQIVYVWLVVISFGRSFPEIR